MTIEGNHDELWVLLDRHLHKALRGGESQDSLARKIGVSQNSISCWLKGERRGHVRLLSILKIIQALDIDPAEVFEILFAKDSLSGIERLRHERDQAVNALDRVRRALDQDPE
ncbi:helix-turn-helix domain-containing protein [Desulfovibrio ferrophilus]|uniref:Predicted transcriptional regulator n=1 Tax=Desulfovibrio ferrophilus TaxID=241368 RepID=A0A2Z6AZ71_9BACT|nr:helix-turn-helix transcriptional regulator [Desulfovibrio ferrophilus]BBD08571.1 predicted transcriptional regulator [Desulfovibrio ferrophilus]